MPIFYITRDGERAAGLLGSGDDSYVITNPSPLADALVEKYPSQVILVKETAPHLSTLDLLRHEHVGGKIQKLSRSEQPHIIVFKTSPQIEKECARNGWILLNPPHEVGAILEEKIGQWRWLQAVSKEAGSWKLEAKNGESNSQIPDSKFQIPLPHVWAGMARERSYDALLEEFDKGPIVQFNRGHTGLGTFRLDDASQWKKLQARFPRREVKISRFYKGKAYTVNAVVTSQKLKLKSQNFGVPSGQCQIIVGHISEQLTGIPACTNNPYATVGNDWSAGALLPHTVQQRIHSCAEAIGNKLAARGYCGLFGIDVILTDDQRVFLIEVNPRQPASTTMETQLQQERGETSMMEWHLFSLSQKSKVKSQKYSVPTERILLNGFQLFFRNIEGRPVSLQEAYRPGRYRMTDKGLIFIAPATSVREAKPHEIFAFSSQKNSSIQPGGEILRIQSKSGMIDTLGKNHLQVIQDISRAILKGK